MINALCPKCGKYHQEGVCWKPTPDTTGPGTDSAAIDVANCPWCFDCGEPYESPRFPDLVLPHDIWRQISPDGEGNGLLCPNCICARLERAGLTCVGVFRSGPLSAPTPPVSVREAAVVLLAKWDADLAAGLHYGPVEFTVLLRTLAAPSGKGGA